MREFKFKAWIDDSTQCNDVEIEEHLGSNGRFIPFMQNLNDWYMDDGETLGSFLLSFGVKQVMQYTGLQDKNGIDIYEGDICADSFDDMFEVTFVEGQFKLVGLGMWRWML